LLLALISSIHLVASQAIYEDEHHVPETDPLVLNMAPGPEGEWQKGVY
jgi:hypothetical protein